jgi:YebC/PmpR family DNA-binding regulatory protein
MPVDNIKRAIARAQGGNEGEIEEIRYEGYGPAGLAVMVDVATDNRNRTAAELRFLFSRNHGSLGESGSVAWIFEPRGILMIDSQGRNEDVMTELVLVDGVVDFIYGDPCEVITEAEAFGKVREALTAQKLVMKDAYLGAVANTTVSPAGNDLQQALTFLDALEEHDDIQRVYSNVDVDEAALEAIL